MNPSGTTPTTIVLHNLFSYVQKGAQKKPVEITAKAAPFIAGNAVGDARDVSSLDEVDAMARAEANRVRALLKSDA